jgi:hypothetical protein
MDPNLNNLFADSAIQSPSQADRHKTSLPNDTIAFEGMFINTKRRDEIPASSLCLDW